VGELPAGIMNYARKQAYSERYLRRYPGDLNPGREPKACPRYLIAPTILAFLSLKENIDAILEIRGEHVVIIARR